MPPSDILAGFVLKKEACERYNRSLRQLARDFGKAITRGDSDVTPNFKLRLEDGTVLDADEVSKEEIQKLRDKGLNPTWFVRESWMLQTYGLRDAQESTDHQAATPPPEVPVSESQPSEAHPTATTDIVASKDELITVLREDNRFLRESLNKERERSSEDRELTKQLHILLKNMQDRLLPEPDRSRGIISVTETRPTTAPPPHDASVSVEPQSETVAKSDASVAKPTKPRPRSKRAATSKPQAKKDGRSTATSKKKPAVRKGTPKPAHKWHEMPTLKRAVSRFFKP